MPISLSGIIPRIDKDIPKGYTYIQVSDYTHLQRELDGLKGKKDKESKARIKSLQESIESTNELLKVLSSGGIIHFHHNTEKIYDISMTNNYSRLFENNVVYKIEPVAMHKTWQTYGNNVTYDLNAFKIVEKFTEMKSLIKSFNKDGILKNFVITHFLSKCYGNDGYTEYRHEFMQFIKDNYTDALPSLYDIFDRFSDYSGDNYKPNETRTKCVKEAYDCGFISLHHEWHYTEATVKYLLMDKEFEILNDFIDSLPNEKIDTLNEFATKYPTNKSTIVITKLALENSDNEVVQKLIKLMGIKSKGITLKVMRYDEDEREDFVFIEKHFDKIEDVKRWLIKEYDTIDMSKIMKGEIDGLGINVEEEWVRLMLEIIE